MNDEYIMNEYYGNISKLTQIQADTFINSLQDSVSYGRDPVIEFDGCAGIGYKYGDRLKELDILKVGDSIEYKLGIVLRGETELAVLSLKDDDVVCLENINLWLDRSTLQVFEVIPEGDMVCSRELNRLKDRVQYIVGSKYEPRRILYPGNDNFPEFINDLCLHLRVNLVEDERLNDGARIMLYELLQSNRLRTIDINERK